VPQSSGDRNNYWYISRWFIAKADFVSQAMNARDLVAWNIRRLRVARGTSAETLAADADVDRAYMSQIERGLGNPTIDVLERIAAVLHVELTELFTLPLPGENPPKPLPGGRRRKKLN
jgi:transcriptional regulator with XRE-family HTH domain